MPGYGGLFDIDGNLIDPNLHSNNLDWNNIPKIGFHYDNAIAHAGNVWDVRGLGTNDTKKVVWFEAAINGEAYFFRCLYCLCLTLSLQLM